jgi:hypothetical protein
MAGEIQDKKDQTSTKDVIKLICVLGFLGTIPYLLLWGSEVSYMVGKWYVDFLIVSSFLIWLSLIAVWKMKKFGVLAYSVILAVTLIVLYRYNPMLSFNSLIIPAVVLMILWYNFKRMT